MPGADPLAIYVHWPFCLSKCPYCDFNSHVRDSVDQSRWRAALRRELDHYGSRTGRRPVNSLFFGGGTPSLMPPATVETVIAHVADRFDLADDAEITLEANPTSVEAQAFADLRAAGVNRLSLGVQSLDDDALRFLGRGHDAAQARAAAELAARLFPRWSIDLIYALPDQTPADWAAMIDAALTLTGDHVSLYQLTIEPQTAFEGAVRRGAFTPLADDPAAALYERAQDRLEAAGLPAYEISNHARPGGESRHNLQYWRYGDYAGVGPGAHGRLTINGEKRALRQHRAPEIWLSRVESAGHATRTDEALSRETQLREALLMGLRLSSGVSVSRLKETLKCDPISGIDTAFLDAAVDEGLMAFDGDRLAARRQGLRVLDGLLARLIRNDR